MKEGIAIQVKNVSKTFKIPHEKISTVRGAFVNVFISFTTYLTSFIRLANIKLLKTPVLTLLGTAGF